MCGTVRSRHQRRRPTVCGPVAEPVTDGLMARGVKRGAWRRLGEDCGHGLLRTQAVPTLERGDSEKHR